MGLSKNSFSLRLCSGSGSFTPSVTASDYVPAQVDFRDGDSISFPVGFGAHNADIGVYFTQFGEIYYNEYSAGSGTWWTDPSGLPAPTLLSHEGFPGIPNGFISEVFAGGSDLFLAEVFGPAVIQSFTATVGTTQVDMLRYDNLHKGLAFYAKDDGGVDPEGDGTGFNRLFCRIRD